MKRRVTGVCRYREPRMVETRCECCGEEQLGASVWKQQCK